MVFESLRGTVKHDNYRFQQDSQPTSDTVHHSLKSLCITDRLYDTLHSLEIYEPQIY